MKSVSASRANQDFSRLLRQVEETGESVRILRRGRAVARLVPERVDRMSDPAWRAAFERMMAGLEEGAHLRGLMMASRDELHER